MSKLEELLKSFKESPVLAMVAVPDKGVAIPLAEALIKGGVKWMELTFRNEYCEDALKELKESGLEIHYGAGTVRNKEQVKQAFDAGAEFIVSPGFDEGVVKYAQELGIPFFPGIDSTLGIEKAQHLGLKVLKMFPASLMGGPKWCKAMSGPYFDIQFIPSGGVNIDNLADYLKLPNVIAVGGSFLAPMKLLKEKQFDSITELAKKATEIANSTKNL
jgi:2-dehydro-3-deoxyphosphogluconate aldolase / (4S)-4-hydroxy-2-oxoglutarate aldolase